MESFDQNVIEEDKYQFSFSREFKSYSKKKRLISILFLTFLPIYIVSKGFQIHSWKKTGGDNPPSAKKYYFVMILIYLTPWVIAINVAYWTVYFALWFITFPITFYVVWHDFTKEEIKAGTKNDEFKVIGFKKLSFTFVLLLVLTIIFTYSGFLLLLTITSMIFILRPNFYKRLYFIPKGFLFLSYSFFDFLNLIPGIYVAGEWFIEKDSEIKVMKNPYHIAKHIISNFEPFFILNVGISALIVRILVWILYRDHIPTSTSILSAETLHNWGFLSIFLLVPIIMAIYFSWVWVWDDAELKVAKAKISTGSNDSQKIKETTLLVPVADSVKRLFTYLFGISSIVWLVDIASSQNVKNSVALAPGTLGIIQLMLLAFFFTGVSTIFMGIMYYRSGVHEFLVNKLRTEIKEMYLQGNSSIKICNSGIQDVDKSLL